VNRCKKAESTRPSGRRSSQKRTMLEGSEESDILYRMYYNEEVKKLGI
jgi:hypothetical protein